MVVCKLITVNNRHCLSFYILFFSPELPTIFCDYRLITFNLLSCCLFSTMFRECQCPHYSYRKSRVSTEAALLYLLLSNIAKRKYRRRPVGSKSIKFRECQENVFQHVLIWLISGSTKIRSFTDTIFVKYLPVNEFSISWILNIMITWSLCF